MRVFVTLAMAATLASLPATAAPPADGVRMEIDALLVAIGNSGCQFNRNGVWYDAQRARQHLRYKYEFLAARREVPTAEAFIAAAATQSSLTGRVYEVRCGDGKVIPSSHWLRAELLRLRSASTHVH
jgi:hypothetical protein